ncbi:excinuclease ABC subunit UvrA [Streptomyces johnsoniae]|uniref:UvrABC system protein A n=1 Tax=Streptomyces johnsoniae TaxID=3075532 RepID=A0ABU2S9M5_9ACTN|nr:excinuclease ABC subunit UvrA [Streptomyces sp. DSM 41886]MDT0444800.1 excinuclease ABC subunit UvrA [Streptomyces sp. DSM 41886]
MARHRGIRITGARTHNLRDVTLEIPRDAITVFTGVSGSGKSSVVFDTIAVESQRQLNETFPWFVRNRLPRYERPLADTVTGLTPAVIVDQRPVGGNARSTVGTMTDIGSALRVLFSRCGTPGAGEASAYSFNDPRGMCPECEGLGRARQVDVAALIDRRRTLNEGALRFPGFRVGSWQWQIFARSGLFDAEKPLRDFTAEEWELLLHGSGFKVSRTGGVGVRNGNTYEGLVRRFTRLYVKRDPSELPEGLRHAVEQVVTRGPCQACGGARLNEAARATRVLGRSLPELAAMEIGDLIGVLRRVRDPVGRPIARSAVAGLRRIEAVGLGYLSLGRETATLSGGEGQRLKTVRHLGSSLTGLTYVFDEPSIGLHPGDVHRLLGLLRQLRDQGNTVLVVEHDRDVVAIADHVIDMGPGAGGNGGEVVFAGPVAGLLAADTATGRALRRGVVLKERVRRPSGWLPVEGARLNNLREVSVRVPTGVLTAVTGVAGSGKSSLIHGELCARHPEAVVVDQAPVGASARSTPATYLGIFDQVRKIFSRVTGEAPGLFSFNSRGACPRCRGRGVIHTDLAYMDPVTTRCAACGGRRFVAEVLEHTVRGKSVADVLDFTAGQAADFFADEPGLARPLRSLAEVGLDYLALGQPLASLSGGERQRVKLAAELHRTGGLYVLDEPTTGLHLADVAALVALLDRLVAAGNTVVVIEHDLDVIAGADWVIDLGPGGGRRVLFEGPPAVLAAAEGPATAEHLRRALGAVR